MAIKIAIIGAGSRSFGLKTARDILASTPICGMDLELVLMDINANHLRDASRNARAVAERLGRDVAIASTTELESALTNCDYVVTAIEVERYLYWAMDFHIPRKYGFRQVYGENGGPGGIFHALRNMGPTVHIAKTMNRLCPEAPLLNFTNPEQKL